MIKNILLVLIILLLSNSRGYGQAVTQRQVYFTPNRLSTTIINTGIFNQNIDQINSPSFNWPLGSSTFAVFTTGLTISAKIKGRIRMAAASYEGEYRPGFTFNSYSYTNEDMKIYSVTKYDNQSNNPDYVNYYKMIPYGAPYDDINRNGIFDPGIDRPGVKDATQTVFLCMTDGFSGQHNASEGFGGGTSPMNAEVHVTFWGYNSTLVQDVHFMRYQIINKGNENWDSAYVGFFSDPDVGDATDDYFGCDTILNMGYAYNWDHDDGGSLRGTYGLNPPAVGLKLMRINNSNYIDYKFSSFVSIGRSSSPGPTCEREPDNPTEAYNFMKGLKTDGTPFINPLSLEVTKLCYTGDPESGNGWTEREGGIDNCGGSIIGNLIPKPGGDRKFIASTAIDNVVKPGDTITIFASQLIARGSDHLNSVTKLKELAKKTDHLFNECYLETLTNVNPILTPIPEKYNLFQNYPNPFNPTTTIKFDIPDYSSGFEANTKLTVFDVTGREVVTFVNEKLQPGVYEYEFDGSELSSGMYFYKLEAGGFIETRKMVLVK